MNVRIDMIVTAHAKEILAVDTQQSRVMEALRWEATPLLKFVEEPGVEDVAVNSDGFGWVRRTGEDFRREFAFSSRSAHLILARVASLKGIRFDYENPVLESEFPLDGSRITGITMPLVTATALAIRPHPKVARSLESYVSGGALSV